MKKLETLIKNFAAMTTEDALTAIIDSENVDVTTLSDSEKLAAIAFAELRRALDCKEYRLVLDCNYAQSRMHNADKYLVDYYRLVSNDTKNATMIQFYCTANVKSGKLYYRLCTSCALKNREQFEARAEELGFTVNRDKKTGRAKTTEKKRIAYADIPEVVKLVTAILANEAAQEE